MYPSFPAEHQTRAPLIHRYYAQLEWEQGRPRAALLVLMALVDKAPMSLPADDKEDAPMPSPTRLLICRQKFSEEVARINLVRPSSAGSNGNMWIEAALDWIVCFAWFEYLSAGPGVGVSPAIKIFENAIQELDFRNPDADIVLPATVEKEKNGRGSGMGGSKVYSSTLLTSLSDDLGLESLTAKGPPTKTKICTGPEAELVWIEMAKLVYFHSLQSSSVQQRGSRLTGTGVGAGVGAGGFQPRDLRRVVRDGLVRFPNCSILQSLFFWTEAQQRYHGRVRTWVQEQVSRRPGSGFGSSGGGGASAGGSPRSLSSVIPASTAPLWTLGVFYELWHQEPYNPHAVRSLLESALDSSKTASFSSSPNLWMIYIELELRENARQREINSSALVVRKEKDGSRGYSGSGRSQDRPKSVLPSSSSSSSTSKDNNTVQEGGQELETSAKIKQLLMRALNDCPWYKDLYLLAFEPRMKRLFSLDELDQLYQTMLEKEIRVRCEIPERLSSGGTPKEGEGEPSSNGEDENVHMDSN
ncbi:hypothetical protein K457DRAFT_690528 [Linnemannia elongata AG-77]|uniref:Uncharacterized protein n=1 Tax=Linnemannia elongata AG-77 TaxID=1314771 RepID=A0A197JMC9_9FUNG|nr:hypothetical protein K457DRAFT_690528 [Linnemannia elongata AG-77]